MLQMLLNLITTTQNGSKQLLPENPSNEKIKKQKTRTFGSSSGDTGMTSEGADFLALI